MLAVAVETMTALKLKATGLLTLGQKTVAAVGLVTAAVMEVEHIVGTGVLELEVGKAMAAKVTMKMEMAEVLELVLNTVQHMGQELAAVQVGMKKEIMAEVGQVLEVITNKGGVPIVHGAHKAAKV